MKLARVIGQVVSSHKTGNTGGLRISVIKYLDENLGDRPRSAASIDTVNAKVGDIVLVCMSSSARQTMLTRHVCTDNTIVAIVDSITREGKEILPADSN